MKKIILLLLGMTVITTAQQYKVEMNINGGAKNISETNKVEYIVKNQNGDEVYSILKEVNYDIPYPAAEVYDDGSLVVVRAVDTKIWFYNSLGQLEKKSFIKENAKVNYERTVHMDANDDKAALLIADPTINEDSKIKIYDNSGNLLGAEQIKGNMGAGINLSRDSRRTAVSVSYWEGTELFERTIILDADLNTVAEFPLSFSWAEFSTETREFLGFNNKTLFLTDLENQELLFKKELQNELFADAKIIEGEIVAAIRGRTELKNGKWVSDKFTVKRFDKNGMTLSSETVDNTEFAKLEVISAEKARVDGNVKSLR